MRPRTRTSSHRLRLATQQPNGESTANTSQTSHGARLFTCRFFFGAILIPMRRFTLAVLGTLTACESTQTVPPPSSPAEAAHAPEPTEPTVTRRHLECPPAANDAVTENEDGDAEAASSTNDEFDVARTVQSALGAHARCAAGLFADEAFAQEGGRARIVEHESSVEVFAGSSGGGVYGSHDAYFALIDESRCQARVTVAIAAEDGALWSPASIAIATPDRIAALLHDATLLRAFEPTEADAGLFQLLSRARRQVRVRVTPTFQLLGPLYALSPSVEGEPRPSTVGYVVPIPGLRGEPRRIVEQRFRRGDEDDRGPAPMPALLYVSGTLASHQDHAEGQFIARSFELPGRNRGALVALIDTATHTHRWVLETRVALLGSSVVWRGAYRGYLIGEYHSEHPGEPYEGTGGIALLRLRDGAVYRLDVPSIFEHGWALLARDLEDEASERFETCRESTTRAYAASSGYPISELEDAPYRCREHEALVALNAAVEAACVENEVPAVRVEEGTLVLRTREAPVTLALDEILHAAELREAGLPLVSPGDEEEE